MALATSSITTRRRRMLRRRPASWVLILGGIAALIVFDRSVQSIAAMENAALTPLWMSILLGLSTFMCAMWLHPTANGRVGILKAAAWSTLWYLIVSTVMIASVGHEELQLTYENVALGFVLSSAFMQPVLLFLIVALGFRSGRSPGSK